MKASDFNMYKDWYSDNVVLEVYGLIDQDTGKQDLVEKLQFDSFDSARSYMLRLQVPFIFE